MRLLETDRSFSRLGRPLREWPAGDGTNPKRSHELEARQPVEAFSVPLPQGWVVRRFPYGRVVHNRVAEVIHHGCDFEDAAEAFIAVETREDGQRGKTRSAPADRRGAWRLTRLVDDHSLLRGTPYAAHIIGSHAYGRSRIIRVSVYPPQ
jgi:hypothetical protein